MIHDEDRPWVEMKDLGYEGSYIKVLYVDRETNTVAFLYDMAPGQAFPMHEHRCRVIAYTLEGEWWYDRAQGAEGGHHHLRGQQARPTSPRAARRASRPSSCCSASRARPC